MSALPELINGLPNICGHEAAIAASLQPDRPVFLPKTNLRLESLSATFSIALHMHQPTIPAGLDESPISNLQQMFEHPYEGDNHNAAPFAWCYSRMGDFIPELVAQGCNPRVMLDYSGNLLWGLRQMGRGDVLDNLKRITCDETYSALCRVAWGRCGAMRWCPQLRSLISNSTFKRGSIILRRSLAGKLSHE